MTGKVWLITGCSSGFGRGIAERAIKAGDSVVATARRPETLADLAAMAPDRVITPALDVNDPAQVRAAVASAVEKFGRIDVLVNNAGFTQVGTIEDMSDAEVRGQFGTNFFGVLDLTRAVLPIMRQQGSGRIVNISSGAALGGRPAFGMYCASKAALESASEALVMEVGHFGISVSLVEPGAFTTNLAVAARISSPNPAYAPLFEGMAAALTAAAEQSDDPELVVDCVMHVVASEAPPLRVQVGVDCLEWARERLETLGRDHEVSQKLWAELKANRS